MKAPSPESTLSPAHRDKYLQFLSGQIAQMPAKMQAYAIDRLGKSFVKELGRREGVACRKELRRLVRTARSNPAESAIFD